MPIQIIETHCQSKSHQPGEDHIVVTQAYAAVLDGVTCKTNHRILGKTPGEMAVEIIKHTIQLLPAKSTCDAAIKHINQAILKFYRESHLNEEVAQHPEKRIAASAAIYSEYHQEIWLVGDCQCRCDGQNYSPVKKADRLLAEMRAFILESKLLAGEINLEDLCSNDPGREAILPFLRLQSQFQNCDTDSPYRYSVLDGFTPNPGDVQVIPARGNQVTLASDGYPKLLDTLQESEEYLQYILSTDPYCFREYKSTKGWLQGNHSYDDRAYLRFSIRPSEF